MVATLHPGTRSRRTPTAHTSVSPIIATSWASSTGFGDCSYVGARSTTTTRPTAATLGNGRTTTTNRQIGLTGRNSQSRFDIEKGTPKTLFSVFYVPGMTTMQFSKESFLR